MVTTSYGRLKQLNAAMNVGYDLKVAALAAGPDAQLAIEGAASRGNPFAISAQRSSTDSATAASREKNSRERLLQINASMNKGYTLQLANMSPTRMQAATRGNPFAIFETNSWKSSPAHAQLRTSSSADDDAKMAVHAQADTDTTALRATAAAKGNPFARFASAHSLDQSSSGIKDQSRNAERQRLEASVVHWHDSSKDGSLSNTRQHKSKKPIKTAASAAFRAKFPNNSAAAALPLRAPAAHATVPRPASASLLLKRQPDHPALRVLLPTSPSGSGHLPPQSAAHDTQQNVHDRADCPRGAAASAASVGGSSASAPALLAAEGCGAMSPSIANSPADSRLSPASSCKNEAVEPAVDAPGASSVDFGELTNTIHDLELEIRCLREEMLGDNDRTLSSEAGQEPTVAEASPASSSRARRRSPDQSSQDGENRFGASSIPDFISPRTLFAEPSSDAKLSKRLLPDERPLADMLLHSLKLPPEVAALVARCMHDTARQNQAARADFRAKYSANVEPEPRGDASSVCRVLESAERAVQLRAAREAEEEEERFHEKVAAGLTQRTRGRR
jgi:hypothetical protein